MKRFSVCLAAAVLCAGVSITSLCQAASSEEESRILSALRQDDKSEIEMGKLAQEKSVSQAAKELADRIVRDHQQNNTAIADLAQKENIPLLGPDQDNVLKHAEKEAQDHIDTLRKTKGPDFDKQFAEIALDDHQKDLKKLHADDDSLSKGPIKSLLSQTIPVMEQHLQMAKKLFQATS